MEGTRTANTQYDLTDKIGGFTNKITVVTTATGSYTTDQNIGGAIKLPEVLRNLNATGIISDICFWATANGKFTGFIDFWSNSPTGISDKTSMDITEATNISKWLGCLEIDNTDWHTTGTIDRVHIANVNILAISKIISNEQQAIKDLWITIQTKEDITIDTLTVKVGILQD